MTGAAEPGTDPMLALFGREMLAAAGVLADALAVLTADPDHPVEWEPLERAARSIAGSALLVGRGGVAELGRAIGEAVAEARRSGVRLAPGRLDDLTHAAELAKEIGQDPDTTSSDERLAAAVARLRGRAAAVAAPIAPVVAVPPPPAALPLPPPPPPPSSDAVPLLELFREEVRSLSGTLSSGLVELEAGPGDPRRIEPLMRAAHSLKGAARIVRCEPAVGAAHAMEELLVAAQAGRFAITPPDIDALLAATDLLAQLTDADPAAWAAAQAPAAAAHAATLRARLEGKPAPTPPTAPPPAHVPAPVTAPESAAVEPVERVVRVSADSLTRLLSLAGESLVEARWLQPFARSLLRLRKHQNHLTDVFEDLSRAVRAEAPAGQAGRVAELARKQLAGCRDELAVRIDEFEDHARRSDELNDRLYREVIASRMRPFADGTHGLARMVRDVARQLGKKVRLDVAGQDTDVDRDILDKLEAPLGHILRNAVDHGLELPAERLAAGKPETGTIRLEARHHAGMLDISVADDGRGIDLDRLRRKVADRGLATADMAVRLSEAELLDFLFLPGFSTADAVTDVSGRGVGLDVVQSTVQAVGGTVRVSTRPGQGTTFELQLPITLSVLRAVLVRIAGDPYALPLNRTDRLLRLPADRVRTLEGKPHFEVDGRHVGLVPAHQVLDLPAGDPPGDELAVVLIGDRRHQYGLVVEGFLGEQDLVVRPLDPRLGKVPNVAAASVLEDGSPVLIVDVDDVARSVGMLVHEGKLRHARPAPAGARAVKRVLVVDDSAIVREVERQMLRGRGYEVDVAVDGADGWAAARSGGYDLIVSDIDMPRMNGLELVRAVRADPRVQSTPVVIVSYKERDEDRARGLDAGANYYLTKSSFHDGQFLAAVEELIGGPEGD
jgi:two-component system sensor histidine kinase and response regulator WspE